MFQQLSVSICAELIKENIINCRCDGAFIKNVNVPLPPNTFLMPRIVINAKDPLRII